MPPVPLPSAAHRAPKTQDCAPNALNTRVMCKDIQWYHPKKCDPQTTSCSTKKRSMDPTSFSSLRRFCFPLFQPTKAPHNNIQSTLPPCVVLLMGSSSAPAAQAGHRCLCGTVLLEFDMAVAVAAVVAVATATASAVLETVRVVAEYP